MKAKLFFAAVVAVSLTTAVITSHAATRRMDLLGDTAPVTAAHRTIVVTPETRHVRVEGGEIVKFVVGEKSFAWHFNGPATTFALDLNRIAPADTLAHQVTAYIDPDPLYLPN